MITSVDLTEAEWISLRELRNGPLKRKIPLAHEHKLINLGLAKKLFAGVMLTDEGRVYRRDRTTRETRARSVVRSSIPRLFIVPAGPPPFPSP